jgi:putative transposase
MIDKDSKELSVVRQCEVLEIHRSGFYYKPEVLNDYDDKIMHAIDELHSKDPTLGTRRMKVMLQNRGFKI